MTPVSSTHLYQAAELGITVFVTTHYMDEAEYCNRISMMVDGKIEALDTPQRLKERFHAQEMCIRDRNWNDAADGFPKTRLKGW